MDRGTAARVEIICRMSVRPRNTPPSHQLALVRTLAVCLVPMNASEDDDAPPKLAAIPPPLPA